MKDPTIRRANTAISLQQASMESSLAPLLDLVRESNDRLQSILPLLPIQLRPTLRPGPIVGSAWHVLTDSSASAAKLRQLTPAMLAHLQSLGKDLSAIQVKVSPRAPR